MKKILIAVTAIIFTMLAVGCGSSDNGTTYTSVTPEEPSPTGPEITIASEGDAKLNYSYADNGSIIVGSDNGEINVVGGDGEINVNTDTDLDISNGDDEDNTTDDTTTAP